MLRKRIVGVVTVKDGWAVQSFGYGRYLPLGKVSCLLENLDRWGVDEILLQLIDRSTLSLGPDFSLLEKVSKLGLSTPLTYSGGIRTDGDAVKVIKTGADRVCIDALLHSNLNMIKDISFKLGAQAVVASMPVKCESGKSAWYNYGTKKNNDIESIKDFFNQGVVSEVLITDVVNEGCKNAFNMGILSDIECLNTPIIAFGGISESNQITDVLTMEKTSAVAIGNFLNYTEHAVQALKSELQNIPIRSENYKLDVEYE